MNDALVICCSMITIFGLIAFYIVTRLIESTYEDVHFKLNRKN